MSNESIKKIRKIDTFRIFDNWTGSKFQKCDFTKYNLIFGPNGSGKSTLSALFLGCSNRDTLALNSGLELLKIGKDTSPISADNKEFWRNVKVFCQEFIDANLAFEPTSDEIEGVTTQALLTLGKDSIAANQRHKRLQEELKHTLDQIDTTTKETDSTQQHLDELYRNTANTIRSILQQGPNTKYGTTQSFNKSHVEKLFQAGITETELTEQELASTVKSATSLTTWSTLEIRQSVDHSHICLSVAKLLASTATYRAIRELQDNPSLSKWVQKGLDIHSHLNTCQFCSSPLTTDRKKQLAGHFNSAFSKLQNEVRDAKQKVESILTEIDKYVDNLPNVDTLHPELNAEFQRIKDTVTDEFKNYRNSFVTLRNLLESKGQNLHRPLMDYPDPHSVSFPDLSSLNQVISKHNNLVSTLDTVRKEAEDRLITHYLTEQKPDYDKYSTQLLALRTRKAELEDIEKHLKTELYECTKQLTNPLPAASELTNSLAQILGRDEFEFRYIDDLNCYQLLRNNLPASHLSEGERTAIALLYFLQSLKSKSVSDAPDELPIVLIDDPITSLDQSVAFGISSRLWTDLVETKSVRQLFVFTHNHTFFIRWALLFHTKDEYKILEMKAQPFSRGRELSNAVRVPFLSNWAEGGRTPLTSQSEYHFLFAQVASTFSAYKGKDPGQQVELLSLLPNAARRMLETFLKFRYPSSDFSFARAVQEIESMSGTKIPVSTRDHLIRYLHTYSHSSAGLTDFQFDPESAQLALQGVFRFMYAVDPSHLTEMCRLIKITPEDLWTS